MVLYVYYVTERGFVYYGTANNPVFDPPNDEVGLYVKFNNRKYKVKLDEVT